MCVCPSHKFHLACPYPSLYMQFVNFMIWPPISAQAIFPSQFSVSFFALCGGRGFVGRFGAACKATAFARPLHPWDRRLEEEACFVALVRTLPLRAASLSKKKSRVVVRRTRTTAVREAAGAATATSATQHPLATRTRNQKQLRATVWLSAVTLLGPLWILAALRW